MSKADVYAICMESPTAWAKRDELLAALGLNELPAGDDLTLVAGVTEKWEVSDVCA